MILIFAKQLPQEMKPQILSRIKENLQYIMAIIKQIENKSEVIDFEPKRSQETSLLPRKKSETSTKSTKLSTKSPKNYKNFSPLPHTPLFPPKKRKSFLSNYSNNLNPARQHAIHVN